MTMRNHWSFRFEAKTVALAAALRLAALEAEDAEEQANYERKLAIYKANADMILPRATSHKSEIATMKRYIRALTGAPVTLVLHIDDMEYFGLTGGNALSVNKKATKP